MMQDRLSLVWDTPWQPIRDSQNLQRYWQSDLAREAVLARPARAGRQQSAKRAGWLRLSRAVSACAVRH